MPDREPTTLIFEFTATDDGSFDYDPTESWDYIHGDELVFESKKGPFSVLFDPIEGQHHGDIAGPLEGDENLIVSDAGPDVFRARGKVLCSLTAAERRNLWASHGFIGIYDFKIVVADGERTLRDNSKNGGYGC